MTEYKNHHYVPIWYQNNFIPKELTCKSLFYLDLNPPQKIHKGHSYLPKELNWWGPRKCFCAEDL